MSYKVIYDGATCQRFIDGREVTEAEFDAEWGARHGGIAELLAARQAPKAHGTEQSFTGNRSQYEYEDNVGKLVIEQAHEAGISTQGKHYVGGIADGRGPADPEAWVSDSSDVLRVAKKRGFTVKGAVNYKPPKPDPLPKSRRRLAPDLVLGKMRQLAEKDPDYAARITTRKGYEDAYGQIVDRHGSKS